jgi:uncharacterized caspase-like protein
MNTVSKLLLSCFLLISFALASPLRADSEKRIALVIGNAAYQAGALATPANDAGLIAQTLQAAGFDVTGARDLDGETLRSAFHDFLDKAQASGPDTVAFVYLAGYGVQLDNENYFVPVEAKIASASDVAAEALRISDYTMRLAGLPLKASFIVLDAGRASPFARTGQPLAGGLALAEAAPNMLMAFNAAPGTVAPDESGPYGAYAQALTEMIREGGLSPSQVFDGVRLRVSEATKGAQVPWSASRISAPFVFFERAKDAPPPALETSRIDAMKSRPMRDLGAQDAYAAAIERDTMQGYEEFVAAYPSDPLANRIRALLAARREAITWRQTCQVNSPDAYWSYVNRYPQGPHAADARGRLEALAVPEEPPASFTPIPYEVAPPPPPEIIYVDRPVLVLSDPYFGFVPPPPIVFLAPPPAYLVFPPPLPVVEAFVLPIPVFVPVPVFINPPPYVVPPPNNVIFANIHNTTIINNTRVINQGAPEVRGALGPSTAAGVAAGVAAGAIAARVALPPSVARRATMFGGRESPGSRPGHAMPGAPPGQPGALPSARLPAGHELPGASGKPLPGPGGKPAALPGQPERFPSARLPAGRELPGANGKPPRGLGAKLGTPTGEKGALPGANGKPPRGRLGRNPETPLEEPGASSGANGKPPRGLGRRQGAHALPNGGELSSSPGAHGAPKGVRPGRFMPPEGLAPRQPSLNKPPRGQTPPLRGFGPSGATGKPAFAGPRPPVVPQTERLPQRQPQQFQQRREPPQTYLPPRQPPQAQQWRQPQQAQQWRQPQQAQQWRQPRQAQQWHQPQQAQQQRYCGQPGLPPCR